MVINRLALLGLSAAFLNIASASAHPSHDRSGCMPGMPGDYCIPMPEEKAYEVGQALPEAYGELSQWDRFDLPAPPEGQAYSMIDGDIVLYDKDSKIVLRIAKQLDTSF